MSERPDIEELQTALVQCWLASMHIDDDLTGNDKVERAIEIAVRGVVPKDFILAEFDKLDRDATCDILANVERLEARIRDLERQLEAERARVPDDDHWRTYALGIRDIAHRLSLLFSFEGYSTTKLDGEFDALEASMGDALPPWPPEQPVPDDALPSDFPPPGTWYDANTGNLVGIESPTSPVDAPQSRNVDE